MSHPVGNNAPRTNSEPGGPSAKTFRQASTPNHQNDTEETAAMATQTATAFPDEDGPADPFVTDQVVGPVFESELRPAAENAELARRLGSRAVAVRRATVARASRVVLVVRESERTKQ